MESHSFKAQLIVGNRKDTRRHKLALSGATRRWLRSVQNSLRVDRRDVNQDPVAQSRAD